MGNKNKNLDAKILNDLENTESKSKINFTREKMNKIFPKTENQKKVFNFYDAGYNLLLKGTPGTGKTFLALYKALKEVLSEDSLYKSVTIVRSAVSTREIGFMPGTEEEKLLAYERPYMGICDDFFGYNENNYQNMKDKGLIDFMSTSFIRGLTLKDTIVIVDESENLNYHEIKSVMTRLGENTKIIFCGDIAQTDLNRSSKDRTGMDRFERVCAIMGSMKVVNFNIDDIVRDKLVKEYLIADEEVDKAEPQIIFIEDEDKYN